MSEEAKRRTVARMVAEVMAKTTHAPPKARKARLDPKGEARPLTQIKPVVRNSGNCHLPGIGDETKSYELHDVNPHSSKP